MNKPGPAWQRVLMFLFLGVAVIVIPLVWPGEVIPGIISLSALLGIYLIVEAVAQLDSGTHNTPLYQFIWRYKNRRDRFVAGISLGVLFLVILLPGIFLGDMRRFTWPIKLFIIILSALLAAGSYFAIGYYFGSQELRELMMPRILKRFLKKQN